MTRIYRSNGCQLEPSAQDFPVVNASVSSVFCSSSCAFAEPVAGLALAERFTERTGSLVPASLRNRGKTKESAPMLAGSSCTQTISRGMPRQFRAQFFFRKRIKLIEKNDRGGAVLAPAAFVAQFVADFAGADQHARAVFQFYLGHHGQKSRPRKFLNRGACYRDSATCSSA